MTRMSLGATEGSLFGVLKVWLPGLGCRVLGFWGFGVLGFWGFGV